MAQLVGATSLLAQTTHTVTLAWDPSPDQSVVGYIVHYGNASGIYPVATNVGSATTATIGGLQDGTTYYFVVTAYDASGLQSDPSNEINYTPQPASQPPPPPPPAPTPHTVTLAWDPSPDPAVTGYIVHYGNSSGAYPNSTNVGSATTATVGGLLEGKTYYFVVTAYDAAGLQSDPSNEINYTPQPASPPEPTNSPNWQLIAVQGAALSFSGDVLLGNLAGGATLVGLDSRSAAQGWLRVGAGNLLSYRAPTNGFTGLDSFSFVISNSTSPSLVLTASVQVVTSVQVPAVTITEPAASLLVSVGGNLALTASIGDTNTTISRVDFVANGSLVAVATNQSGSDLKAIWPKATTGTYRLSATAYSQSGQIIGSTPTQLSVVSLPNSGIPANSGLCVEASSDLAQWTRVAAIPASGLPESGVFTVEGNPTSPLRFYRVRPQGSL